MIAWDNIAGWRGLGFKKNWDVTAKLAWRISPSMKIIVPIRFNQRTQRTWFINAFGNFLFAMNGLNVLDDRTDQQTFIFTHQISPKLFYEIRGSRFFKGRTYRIHGIDGHRLTPGHDDEFSEAYQIFYNDPTIEVNFGPQEYPTYTEANDFAIPLTFIRYDTLSDGTIKHIYRGAAERYWARNFQQSI